MGDFKNFKDLVDSRNLDDSGTEEYYGDAIQSDNFSSGRPIIYSNTGRSIFEHADKIKGDSNDNE